MKLEERINMKYYLFLLLSMIIIFNLTADDQAIDFRLEDINGKYQKLSELQNNGLVILDFWATWCTPCKNALPKLNELHKKYDDVTVIAINLDKPRSKAKAVAEIKSNRYEFITLFDPNGNVKKQFNITGIPRTLIIDPMGEIILDHTGYQRGDETKYEQVIIEWQKSKSKAGFDTSFFGRYKSRKKPPTSQTSVLRRLAV